MAEVSPYQQHVQGLLTRSPELARLLVQNTQEAMRASSVDMAMATDRSLLFQVAEVLQSHRHPYEQALAARIQAEIEQHAQPVAKGTSRSVLNLDELTLVDEAQAEQEIEVSRTVQLIELVAEWELRELQAFTSTLQGETRLKPQDNPARPAVYAKALSAATRELPLADKERHMLLRISGKVLADLLKAFYAQTSEQLRQQGWSPQAYKAVTTPRRAPQSDVNVTQPGALQSLLERLPAQASQPAPVPAPASSSAEPSALTFQALGHAWPPGATPASANHARAFSEEQVFDLLNRLFAQMHRDQETQPAICSMIDQLQPAVMRVARSDPQVLRSAEHPAWQLINQLAAYASGYSEPEHAELAAFLNFAQPRIQQIVEPPGPTMAQLEATLSDMHRFIEAQGQAQLQAAPQAVAQLQEADLRLSVHPILLQQVEQQLASRKVKTSIRDFLLGPWVDVLSRVMASLTPDEDEIQAMMSTVDDLLHSLQRPVNLDEREQLRQSLPGLIDRLKRGMASIALAQEQQDAILDDLMGIHTHHLLANPKAAKRPVEPSAQDIVAQMRQEMRQEMRQQTSQETRERDNAGAPSDRRASNHPQLVDTNLGNLPTVPMAYGEDMPDTTRASTPAQWADALQKGMWCKLFLQGQWTTAHLLWISANRQFYMFTSERAGRMHSMTRRALERLRAEGLATDLEDRSLMQRAVDSMLQDLHD